MEVAVAVVDGGVDDARLVQALELHLRSVLANADDETFCVRAAGSPTQLRDDCDVRIVFEDIGAIHVMAAGDDHDEQDQREPSHNSPDRSALATACDFECTCSLR
jgi:hypothetical protein